MIFLRLLPIILSTLLLAAHILRFYGLTPAIVTFMLLLTLFLRKTWTIRLWQALLTIAIFVWIHTAFVLVRLRLELELDWRRLFLIMAGVMAFNIFSIFWLNNKNIKAFYLSKSQSTVSTENQN